MSDLNLDEMLRSLFEITRAREARGPQEHIEFWVTAESAPRFREIMNAMYNECQPVKDEVTEQEYWSHFGV